MQIISNQFTKNDQNVDLVIVEQHSESGKKVRYSICSNAYDFQSYARSETWTESGWKTVHSIMSNLMKTPHGLYAQCRRTELRWFDDDLQELRRVTQAILGIR